jgi:hypothetical protein
MLHEHEKVVAVEQREYLWEEESTPSSGPDRFRCRNSVALLTRAALECCWPQGYDRMLCQVEIR